MLGGGGDQGQGGDFIRQGGKRAHLCRRDKSPPVHC